MQEQNIYVAIDLKTFYASVECVERGLDPFNTNLVVADSSRTEKTICLAVSPSLKQYGIPGRARLFEVVQKVREINTNRKYNAPGHILNGKSYEDIELKKYPEYELDYIIAPPQMNKYMKYSTDIYKIYLKYFSADDMFIYSIDEVFINVTNYLKNYVNPVLAEKYIKWRNVRKSKEPLIILIGGASGVGTSSMAFELASRLGLKNLISTDMIREVMRKIVSKELSPVIHKSSFNAYESIRTPLLGPDPVVEGFISHVDVVNVGVEAVIERALKEGISIIIEGVHIVPGFIKEDLIRKSNVILFTLIVRDEDTHKSRFYSRCRQPWVKRSLDNYLSNFHLIRKTQSFMIDQAIKHNSKIIDNVDVKYTIDIMVNDIIEKYGGSYDVRQESKGNNDN